MSEDSETWSTCSHIPRVQQQTTEGKNNTFIMKYEDESLRLGTSIRLCIAENHHGMWTNPYNSCQI